MSARRDKKRAERARRNAAKKSRMKSGEKHESNYGKKKAYLYAHGLWGFEVPSPKPWKSA